MEDRIDITVALVTYNRSKLLRVALESLVNQRLDGILNYEIVVVDDGSTDNTRDVVSDVAEKNKIQIVYVYQDGKGVANARNETIRKARGSWIAFFDDDQIAEPTYLKELYLTAKKINADCIGGTRLLNIQQDQLDQIHPFCRALLGEIEYKQECEKNNWKWFPCTGNSMVKKDVFEKVGYFNESIITGGSDLDFFRRCRMQKLRIWQTPNAVLYHIVPSFRFNYSYLRRAALRSGINFAYMNYHEWGMVKALFHLAVLLCHSIIIVFPRLLWAQIRRDKNQVVGEKCRLLKVLGYTRRIPQLSWPRMFKQEDFFSKLEFRKEIDREKNH